jgi:hypothetical protein
VAPELPPWVTTLKTSCEANFGDVEPCSKDGTRTCTMLVGAEVTTVELGVVLDATVSGEKAI